ncbi:MAG: hypothetical protein J6M24_02785 [Lachnospiraceae bacterium]|nr:hypothetical protein [Lachnospiraceae bacterium]
MEDKKFRFALSFSAGKDSFLALKKMLELGHEPACLITAVNPIGLSHMHGMRVKQFRQYAKSLGIPVIFEVTEKKYDREAALKVAREAKEKYGADATCTGDIAFEFARDFNKSVAEELGMTGIYPLFGMTEEEFVPELLSSGCRIMIKTLATELGLDELVGKELDANAVDILAKKGIRLTDDTAELHTVVVDGPMFKYPVNYRFGELRHIKEYSMVDMIPLD